MTLITSLTDRYKRLRTMAGLRRTYEGPYAFVGMGSHSLANLYPVLDYLNVPLKYICCRSAAKARLMARRRPGVKVTTALSDVLDDPAVKGVLVAAAPSAHFALAAEVLASGKSLFVEKPPCFTADELARLAALQQAHGVPVAVVGMQQRCAPVTRLLKQQLRACRHVSYNLKYLTGAYPEGDALTDLFIHPLDYAVYLFGPAEVAGCEYVGGHTLLLLLKHRDATGVAELSTGYSWATAEEALTVNTPRGVYEMRQTDSLVFRPRCGTVAGLPLEKVFRRRAAAVTLFGRNNFVPTMPNNQVVTQGYFDLLKDFADAVEGRRVPHLPTPASLAATYDLMGAVRRAMASQ